MWDHQVSWLLHFDTYSFDTCEQSSIELSGNFSTDFNKSWITYPFLYFIEAMFFVFDLQKH